MQVLLGQVEPHIRQRQWIATKNEGKFISYSTQKLWEHEGDKEIDEETEGQEESEKGTSLKGALVLTNLWLKQNRKNKAMVGNEMLSLGNVYKRPC